MTEDPQLNLAELKEAVFEFFGLPVVNLSFLPVGADTRSFSYRVKSERGVDYFLKLRRENGNGLNYSIPAMLGESGMVGILSPLRNKIDQRVWAQYGPYQLSIVPFVSGQDGWDYTLAESQWYQLGTSLRFLHDRPWDTVFDSLPQETFDLSVVRTVNEYVLGKRPQTANDEFAVGLRALLVAKADVIFEIIEKVETLTQVMQEKKPKLVLTHGDLHSGNLLIDQRGTVHIIDWDNVAAAPRERDLMFVGAGIGGLLDKDPGNHLFYRGYGNTEVDPVAISYYRLHRILTDVQAHCELLFDTGGGGGDRLVLLDQAKRQFEPKGVVDIALRG